VAELPTRFATRLNNKWVDIVTVKQLLGHSSVKVKMRYAHSSREANASAVRSLSAAVVTK
jgi:site-specific recombinase XerD